MFAMHLSAFVLYFCTFCRRLGVFAFLCILNYCVLVDKPLFLTSINALFQEMLYLYCIVLYFRLFRITLLPRMQQFTSQGVTRGEGQAFSFEKPGGPRMARAALSRRAIDGPNVGKLT